MNGKYKIGDQVLHLQYGWGKVVNINTSDYPLEVKHDDISPYSLQFYLLSGRQDISCLYPTLLTVSEAKALGYEPPKKKVKKTMYANVYQDVSRKVIENNLYATKQEALNRVHPSTWFVHPSAWIDIAEVTFEVDE